MTQIDSFTVVLFGIFIKVVLGCLFLVFWKQHRGATWYAWWSGTFFFACVASVIFTIRGFTTDLLSIGIGIAAMILAFAFCWQGARAFDRRPILWLPMVAAPSVWFAACLVPGFMDNVVYRVVLSSLIITSLLAMTAFEFWRGRSEPLPSRWPVIVLCSSFALVFAIRIPMIGVLPFPFGALPMQAGAVGTFNLVMFFHTLLLTVLFVAMSKERLELDQRVKAQTDPLTGALNRRAFLTRGARLLHRHEVESAPLCMLFLDLDRFKSLNDRFGHSGGDDVLIRFVALTHENIRPTDFLFRLGGEEFCCLLPYTSVAQAHRVAERVRHQLEAATVDVAGTSIKTTVSVGISSTEDFGYDLETLMRRADAAVYVAKQQGRNRVVVATADNMAAPGDLASAVRAAS